MRFHYISMASTAEAGSHRPFSPAIQTKSLSSPFSQWGKEGDWGQACNYFDLEPGSFPAAMQAASGFVSLPMFPGRTDDRIIRVCQCIKKFHSKEPQEAMR